MRNLLVTVIVVLLVPTAGLAFDGHQVTEGPLTLSIEPIQPVTEYDRPIAVRVRLKNAAGSELQGTVEVGDLLDGWRVIGRTEYPFAPPAGQEAQLEFTVSVGQKAYSALYPIHVHARFRHGNEERIAHAVYIVKTAFAHPAAVTASPAPPPRVWSRPPTGVLRSLFKTVAAIAASRELPVGEALAITQGRVGSVRTAIQKGYAFRISDGAEVYGVIIKPGRLGLVDATLGIGYSEDNGVAIAGLPVSVNGEAVGASPSLRLEHVEQRGSGGRLTGIHHLRDQRGLFVLAITLWTEHTGLRVRFACSSDPPERTNLADPRRITDLQLGPFHTRADRVYYGHGYCIIRPRGFSAGFGGHNLSTSHVGFDFDTGLSLLQAVDNPPDRLEVQPEQGLYTLHTHMNATMTLVAGKSGAFDCAVRYQDLYDKPAAGGVSRLAGRFVYDVWWGGPFARTASQMERMARYGCTDAILTLHDWQRWGYDYRLPDVFPPDPRKGGVEGLRQLGETCTRNGILWGLHDNYADFYPDATGFNYDRVCFNRDGTPRLAWRHVARQAQSYRWRPDALMPFLQKNVNALKASVQPTHSFLDTFSSIGMYDYYDATGRFHSMLETRRQMGEAFAWIRDTLGVAPTTSEAGHDQLVGYLDGADCQFLTLSKEPRPSRFVITMRCDDWERVPWYDTVLHDRLVLHGVGYGSRYQPNRPGQRRGLTGDDYISAEVLTGHPAMTDARGLGGPAVRKYWLLHDLGRDLAMQRIRDVRFEGGDIHRQRISWANGTTVRVNRGPSDWTVRGHVLPEFGFLVEGRGLSAAVERMGGAVVEHVRGPSGFYCNARNWTGDSDGGRGRTSTQKRAGDKLASRPAGGVVDFGPVITNGACRVEPIPGGVRVMPLPDSPPFAIRLRPGKLGHAGAISGAGISTLDEAGNKTGETRLPTVDREIAFDHDGRTFAYDLRWMSTPP